MRSSSAFSIPSSALAPASRIIEAIVDNCATHTHPKVKTCLTRHPPWTFHFTPTSHYSLNAVEMFFSASSASGYGVADPNSIDPSIGATQSRGLRLNGLRHLYPRQTEQIAGSGITLGRTGFTQPSWPGLTKLGPAMTITVVPRGHLRP